MKARTNGVEWLARRSAGVGSDWIATPLRVAHSAQPRSGRLTTLFRAADHVYLLAPLTDVHAAVVRLPKMAAKELVSAIPYALEDRLAQEPGNLLFGIATSVDDTHRVHVASKARVAGWVAEASEAGATVVAVYTSWSLLPASSSALQVFVFADLIAIREPSGEAAAGEAALMNVVLAQRLSAQATWQGIDLYGELPSEMEASLDWGSHAVNRHGAPDWPTLYAQTARRERVDLLRTARSQQSSTRLGAHWRRAGVAIIASLVLLAGGAALDLRDLRVQRDSWDNRAAAAYQVAFPSERNVADVRRRLQQKLRARTGSEAANATLLPTLALVSKVLPRTPNVQLTGLRYAASGQAEFALRAAALADLQKLVGLMRELAPESQAELASALATQDGARATLRLKVRT